MYQCEKVDTHNLNVLYQQMNTGCENVSKKAH